MMENTKYTFVALPGVSKVLRGEGYEYRINKRKAGNTYWICLQKNCRGTAFTVNDDIDTAKRGDVNHNHRPDQKVQKKMTDMYQRNEENTDGNKKDQKSTSSGSETDNIQETENIQAEMSDNEGNTDGYVQKKGLGYEHLKKEAKKKNLEIHDIPKDGNCLFHAICDQLRVSKLGLSEDHRQLRSQLVEYIEAHANRFNGFLVDETMEVFCRRMKKDGEWGDHLVIQAFADKCKIKVDITSTSSAFKQTIQPSGDTVESTITIGHIPEFHYVSLRHFEADQVSITDNSEALQSNLTDSSYSAESDVNMDATGVEGGGEKGEGGGEEGEEGEGGGEEGEEGEGGGEEGGGEKGGGGEEGGGEKEGEEEEEVGEEGEGEEGGEEGVGEEEVGEGEEGEEAVGEEGVGEEEVGEEGEGEEGGGEEGGGEEGGEEEEDVTTRPFPEMNLSKIIMDKESPEEVIKMLIGYKLTVKCPGTPEQGVNESASPRVGDVSAKGNRNDESLNRVDDQGNERTENDMPLINELELNETIKIQIENHPSKYQVKLFVITSTHDSAMSVAVNSIVEGTQTMETSNTSRSFMIFFFKDEDPDMFVMTSGQAYRKVQSKSCPHFPKNVAKRLLEFKTIQIETRNVTGKMEQTRKIFRPNCPEVPNILDLIHVIVHSYTASPTFLSSLYDLPGFEERKDCKFTVIPFFLKAHTTLFFTEMLSFIKHVADIDKGKDTFLCERRLIDCDTVTNEKFEIVTDAELKSDLDKWLLLHLNGPGTDNFTIIKEDSKECSLYLKHKHKPFKTLTSPFTLQDILKAFRDCCTIENLCTLKLRANGGRRSLLTSSLDVNVTLNNLQYQFREASWYRNDKKETDKTMIVALKDEFKKQILNPQFFDSKNEINLDTPNTWTKPYELFKVKTRRSIESWDTKPSLGDICIAFVEHTRGIKFRFSRLIDNIMVQSGKEKKSIRKFINMERIDFSYNGNRYHYSLVRNAFFKVDESMNCQENDDDRFKCFELIQEETVKQVIGELEKGFDKSLKRPSDLYIPLSLPDLSERMDMGTFKLYLGTKKNPEKEWPRMPATLNEVLDASDECKTNISLDWLRNRAKFTMQFKGKSTWKRKPIAELLVHQIMFENKQYFFWHGKWLKIKAEFVGIVVETFQNLLQKCTLTNENILPLPWVYTGKCGTTNLKSQSFQMSDLIKFMKLSFPKMTEETSKDVLDKISCDKIPDTDKGITYIKHQYEKEDTVIVMLMFLRVHSNVVELLYNTSYILYDRYLNNPGEGYIVGDQICTRNIEMFDILKFDQKKTYLIHVKDGFGQTVRDVCSQIKNSAKLLFNSLTTHSTHCTLEEMWEKYISEPDRNQAQYSYRRATMNKMKQLTKEKFLSLFNTKKRQLVYVLAVRDENKDKKLKEEEAMTKVLAQHYGDEQAKNILEALKKQDYVTDQFFGKYILTDKFRLQKDEFIKTMEDSIEKDSKSVWTDVFELLQKYLPRTGSTIAQLEIVELFNDFDTHYGSKLTLQLFFLPTSLDDLEKGFPMKKE